MNIKNLTTDKFNWWNSMKYILLHHTAYWKDKDWKLMADLLSSWKKQVSCHYVVWQDWTIWRIGGDNQRQWHAWESEIIFLWIKDWNSNSIWIEIDSDWTNFSKEQIESTNELVLFLCKEHNISYKNIYRHADITKRKWDVWPNFFLNQGFKGLEEYKNYIGSLLTIVVIMTNYKELFEKKYWKSSFFNDMEGAAKNLTSPEQIAYFLAIWLERVKEYIDKK